MRRIRFAVAGSGWRAMFYVRAAQNLPERFELAGVLCRTREKAEAFAGQHGVPAFDSLDALLAARPEFVVSCVSKASMAEMVMELLRRGMPVLSETPLAIDEETLERVEQTQRSTGTPLEMAEQYFLYPGHAARIAVIGTGALGRVHSVWLSMMHDYHGISMLRAFLGEEIRTLAQLDYGDGRMGLYDFSGTQYHSAIRSGHVRILGTRGEIFDDDVRWVDAQGRPQQERLQVERDRMSGTVRAVSFLGERLYENPFRADVTMSEDEIAVCSVLERMGETLRTGQPFYPLAHAFRDAYIACLMAGAADEDGRIHTVAMDWD